MARASVSPIVYSPPTRPHGIHYWGRGAGPEYDLTPGTPAPTEDGVRRALRAWLRGRDAICRPSCPNGSANASVTHWQALDAATGERDGKRRLEWTRFADT